MQYNFTVPNGSYTVNLHFADNYSGTFAIGARVFDVNIEGILVLDNHDIFNEAGPSTALMKSIPVTVNDGQLTIDFIHGVENPAISAIEIISVSTTPDTQAPTVPTNVTATAISTSQIDLSWTASTDSGGGAVTGYKVYRDGNATAIATVTGTSYADTGLTANTAYVYTVSAIDTANPANESLPSSSVTATTLANNTSVTIRVNAGGAQYTDGLGNIWAADTGFNVGNVTGTYYTGPVNATLEDFLYQSDRWDDTAVPELQYSFTVPNGNYSVTLHFNEKYSGAFAIGARVFDVLIEGNLALNNLDVYAEAGSDTALTKTIPVTVSDGQLTIDFLHGVQNPMISAIEIMGQN